MFVLFNVECLIKCSDEKGKKSKKKPTTDLDVSDH